MTFRSSKERSQAARLRALAGELALQLGLTKMTAPDATTHLRDLPMELPPMLPIAHSNLTAACRAVSKVTTESLAAMHNFSEIQSAVKTAVAQNKTVEELAADPAFRELVQRGVTGLNPFPDPGRHARMEMFSKLPEFDSPKG